MLGSAYKSFQVNVSEVGGGEGALELMSKVSDYPGEVARQKQMDIFSLGCTILDVLLNGTFMMTY